MRRLIAATRRVLWRLMGPQTIVINHSGASVADREAVGREIDALIANGRRTYGGE